MAGDASAGLGRLSGCVWTTDPRTNPPTEPKVPHLHTRAAIQPPRSKNIPAAKECPPLVAVRSQRPRWPHAGSEPAHLAGEPPPVAARRLEEDVLALQVCVGACKNALQMRGGAQNWRCALKPPLAHWHTCMAPCKAPTLPTHPPGPTPATEPPQGSSLKHTIWRATSPPCSMLQEECKYSIAVAMSRRLVRTKPCACAGRNGHGGV